MECDQNPVALLNRLPQRRIEELSRDDFFLQRLGDAKRALDHYLSRRHTTFKFPVMPDRNMAVAYFSLEYGIAMCLPIYSGGLGVLAGDHLKSASDLNVPLVAVGLLYREGYFRQYMTPDGWQQERYPDQDFEQMPLKPAMHGGVIYVRGEVPAEQIGPGLSAQPLDDADKAVISELVKEYAKELGLDAKEILAADFVKIKPFSHRPYGNLYVPA